jgi:deoxyribose-phosphate aldolase
MTQTALTESAQALAGQIDHTLLKPEATYGQIDKLCQEAREYGFVSVCVTPVQVARCAAALRGTPVKVCTVIGFPLGATLSSVKVYETLQAIALGATEIDMVMNIGALKSGDLMAVQADIAVVAETCHSHEAICKVIIEACLLSNDEKITACRLAQAANADFVKTSTGFSTTGATVDDVQLMRQIVGPFMGVKAAGGIRTLQQARAMITAGASRIGASASVSIMRELFEQPVS